MKVLVAYDGSLDSKAALKYGIQRVREVTGELIALYVFSSHRDVDDNAGSRAKERARRDAFRHLDEAREFIRSNGRDGIKARVVFTEGHARTEILSYATKEDVDMIVVPSSLDSLMDAACCLVNVVSADDEVDAVTSAILNSPGVLAESRARSTVVLASD
jgi:nucleotide-binding universal stress UspA family protein